MNFNAKKFQLHCSPLRIQFGCGESLHCQTLNKSETSSALEMSPCHWKHMTLQLNRKNWWPFLQPGSDIICVLENLNGWRPANMKNLVLFLGHTLLLMESVKTPCSVSRCCKTNQWIKLTTEATPILEVQCWKDPTFAKNGKG